MGWEDQGRQDYGWFGHGTGPGGETETSGSGLFGPGQLGNRAMAAVHGSLAALPKALRAQGSTAHEAGSMGRLQGLLVRWSGASRLDDAAFASRFLGRGARHEQAVGLRRVMGSQSGLIYRRDGVPLDVDHMSDDDVLALDKETRGQSPAPLVAGAAATLKTPWGWKGQQRYNNAVKQLKEERTHETLDGIVPTREEAVSMIKESGGKIDRIEEGHHPDGDSTHTEPHINYRTAGERPKGDKKATVIVKPWEKEND